MCHASHRARIVVPTAVLLAASLASAQGPVVDPAFAPGSSLYNYVGTGVGPLPGGLTNYGGLAFDVSGNLLVGVDANMATGEIWVVALTRNALGHITGFASAPPPTCYCPGPFNTGGLSYQSYQSPGFGSLFVPSSDPLLTQASLQQWDPQPDPGPDGVCGTPDDIPLSCSVAVPTPTPLTGIPPVLGGIGWFLAPASTSPPLPVRFLFKAIAGDVWYDVPFTGTGSGCLGNSIYAFSAPTVALPLAGASGSGGFAYAGGCSPPFDVIQAVFVCESTGIFVYDTGLSGNGDPMTGTRRPFATFPGPPGAAFDPVTGDLVTSNSNSIGIITGFSLIPVPFPLCPCDFSHDAFVNSQDFFDFLNCFFTPGCAEANVNCDGIVTSQDFFDFLICYFSPPPGCP